MACNLLTPLTIEQAMEEFAPTTAYTWRRSSDGNTTTEKGFTAPNYALVIDDKKYFCHPIILGAFSNFFSSSFSSMPSLKGETNLTELLPPFCHEFVDVALDFVYQSFHHATNNYEKYHVVNINNIIPLWKIAHVLRIPLLARQCLEWINVDLQTINAFDIMYETNEFGSAMEKIRSISLQKIANNFRQCEKDWFLKLGLEPLKNVLENVSSMHPQKVSDIALHYIQHVANNLKEHAETVFVQLSECIHQVRSKDALYLYGLSLRFGDDSTSNMCRSVINKNYHQLNHDDLNAIEDAAIRCALTFNYETATRDSMLKMDANTVVEIFELVNRDFQVDEFKRCSFIVDYLKHTDNETKESVFLKLSTCINQIESKDALYLYGLSLRFGDDSTSNMCRSVINKNYHQLNHDDLNAIEDAAIRCALTFNYETATRDSMLKMDANTVVEIFELVNRDFQVDEFKRCSFIVDYLKHTDNETKESVFLKLSTCINQIESKDALYLYGLSSKCKLNRLCSITEKIVTAEFYLLVKGSKDVLSEIGHFDTVCHLLDLDELIVESEDQVYDAIHSYCHNSSLQLSPQQQQTLWLRCRFHQLSDLLNFFDM